MKKRISNSNLLSMIGGLCLFICLISGCGKVDSTEEASFAESEQLTEEAVIEEETEETGTNADTEAVENTEPTEEAETAAELGSFVVYLSGIDVWGWVDTQSRSDVNIIAAVNTETRHIQLINTPRDYYVQMPISDEIKDKLTHAGLYGVENSMGTLENLYGIDIDYYLKMNFSGFEAIIDAVGGVDVYSEYDFTVEPIKHYMEGYNHLTGLEALAFVRERKSFASGDNQRGRNQMALVQAMTKKVCTPEFLLNYSDVMEQLTDMFRTDIPAELIVDLVKNQLLDDTEWTVDIFSVTGVGGSEKTYSSPNSNSYVMIPDEGDVAEAKQLIEGVMNE